MRHLSSAEDAVVDGFALWTAQEVFDVVVFHQCFLLVTQPANHLQVLNAVHITATEFFALDVIEFIGCPHRCSVFRILVLFALQKAITHIAAIALRSHHGLDHFVSFCSRHGNILSVVWC